MKYIHKNLFGSVWFEYVPKNPGHKLSLYWGEHGQFTLYLGTNTHRFGKLYFFRDRATPVAITEYSVIVKDSDNHPAYYRAQAEWGPAAWTRIFAYAAPYADKHNARRIARQLGAEVFHVIVNVYKSNK